MKPGVSVGYTVHDYGYDVNVYDEDGQPVEQYQAGNNALISDAAAAVERGDPSRLSKTTLRRFAKQTAMEMADSHSIDHSHVYQEEEEG
jgi:hypothetical protein